MTKIRITLGLLAVTGLFLATGCSDKKPTASGNTGPDTTATNTTTWTNGGYWQSLLDATSSSHFIYYSFARRDTVTLTDSQASSDTAWNVGFKRSTIIMNGGVSGAGDDEGVDLAAHGHADSTDFLGFDNLAEIGSSEWASDSYNLVIDEWYSYNQIDHTLVPSLKVYVMKDAVGNYVKFQVLSLDHPGMPPNMGTISIQFIYSGSSPSFAGLNPDTITFDGSSGGPVYVDFSAGATTTPTDPRNSTDWDLAFVNYEIHQNATVFGIGACGAYEVWQDQADPTSFDETQVAPTQPQAYFADQFGSVMSEWYNYDGNTHTLTSKNHVYVIRDGGHHYKLQIIAYYADINGTPVSGWYTFRWLALD